MQYIEVIWYPFEDLGVPGLCFTELLLVMRSRRLPEDVSQFVTIHYRRHIASRANPLNVLSQFSGDGRLIRDSSKD